METVDRRHHDAGYAPLAVVLSTRSRHAAR